MRRKRMRMRGLARQPVKGPALPPSPAPALSLLVSVWWLVLRYTWSVYLLSAYFLSMFSHLCHRPKLDSHF